MSVYRDFYSQYFGNLPLENSSNEVSISNPFRNDPNPSLKVNLETGKFNDFGSDLKGDAYSLYMRMHSVPFQIAKGQVDTYVSTGNLPIAPIPKALIQSWHYALLAQKDRLNYLLTQRGLDISTIEHFQIGWNDAEKRYTIPILNEFGICVNVRKYSTESNVIGKMIPYAKGYGQNRIFPLEVLSQEGPLFFFEGEWDALLQYSKGLNAFTVTAGAGSWKEEWSELFKDREVYICFDCDDAGRAGSQKIGEILSEHAKSVKIITLPLSGSKGDNDITDYFLKRNFTDEDFKRLIEGAVKVVPVDRIESSKKVKLAEARESIFKDKRIAFDVRVIGKDIAPYNVPKRILYRCLSDNTDNKVCEKCPVNIMGGEMTIQTDKALDILELIKTTKASKKSTLQKASGIPSKCTSVEIEELESINIEEILIAPEVQDLSEYNANQSQYIVQTAYSIGENLDTNRSYTLEGKMQPDPWQQHVTFKLDKSIPLQATVETFKMSPATYQELQIFQPKNQTVVEKFKEIHQEFENHVTHIIGRDDLLTGIDLVYHSALSFKFQGIPIQKGYLEMLCIGDTRTGKSETTSKMMKHFQLGEMSVAENTSFAGLVGGLQQSNDRRWFLTWGKLPLNDGRIFIIDEASGLTQDDIAKMSGIRSSGVAEITKIQTERTASRTRLIWLSNPRSGRPLSAFSYGVQTIPELIGKTEDISRFDFVVTAAKGEVPLEEINSRGNAQGESPLRYTTHLCKQLILWAWSRKENDIVFQDDAVDLILEGAIKMGNLYSARIPLVEGANQRIKLAKLAVATAIRMFSTDETGEKVIVTREHAKFAYDYLNQLYQKPSLNYKGFSIGEFLDNKAAKDYKQEILNILNGTPEFGLLCLRQDYIWARTLEEQLNLTRMEANEMISTFTKYRMLKESNARGYFKTEGFINILREWEASRIDEYLSI